MSGFQLQRLGMLMEPEPANPQEIEGVLNPAAARGADGKLYLFPRLVAKNNYSRIGIARVKFNEAGDPCGVERLGIALEPEADYERLPGGGGGCEDARVTFVEPLQHYVMTYTALSPNGPRIALAMSEDLFHWERIGLATFEPFQGIDFVKVDNKDANIFPVAIPNHAGKMQLGLLHRPLFPGTRPEETADQSESRIVDREHESIWISYCPMPPKGLAPHRPGLFNSHHRLATPVSPWEKLKIGGGTPPILTKHGWLILYHGVSKMAELGSDGRQLCYSAGVMVLSKEHPRTIRYRSAEPVLTPELPQERHGTIANVVFPTGIDRRDDLGTPDRFDVYYGMADNQIGVARLDLPEHLPAGAAADPREKGVKHPTVKFQNREKTNTMKPDADQTQAPEPKPGASTELKPNAADAKTDAKPNAKPDLKTGAKSEVMPAPQDDLKTLPVAEVEKKLGSSSEGLTQAEAEKRLTQYGPNELEEKKTNPILKFLSYFWGPIPWMIEVAVILSGVVRHWPDFFIILLLLVANGVVGFWEEHTAGNAIEALKAQLAIKARVKRDGKWINPPARELVPGDVIRMRLGDIVPADARLLDGDPVEVDQSALTGESLPAERKSGDAVFSGSIIRQGEIGALVYATGANTYFGRTASLVQEAHTVSHFQKAVLKIGNYLIILAVAMVAVIITVAIFRGDAILTTLQFALVLTVAAIPVAMPTVLSVTMAVGARLLARKKAIVSKLVAIEELAGVDVLCADKTGTLTQNKLTLGDPFSVNNVPADQVILNGALASRADNNDTIDLAVLGGLKDKDALKAYDVVHFQPFDPVHKRTEATVKTKDGKTFKVTKGAPQVILKLAANAGQVKPEVEKAVNEFAARGFRSLGVARDEGDGQWQFIGVLPLFDPPREDAKATIATALAMGVKIKMVTGDALAIAKETAKKLDMGTNILDAASLGNSKKEESAEVAESIEKADGFAQVFPEHKFHIVDVLQKRGHMVGMTGDGVNDAPALKKADCGIAVSGATDAARAAAAIVLTNPGLSVIIDAIKESRRIFQRMNSYAIYRIAETLRVLLFMTAAILIFNFYPLTAVMIVMLALLNDGAILSIAYDNVHYKDEPEAWNMRLVLGIASVLGIVGPIAAFGLFYLGDRVFHLDHPHLQPMMYLMLSVAGHLTIFLTRTRGPFWSIRPAKILWMAVLGTQIIATFIAVYGFLMPPLGWGWAGFVWAYALVWFLVSDRVKLLAYRIFDPVKAATKTEPNKVETKPDPKAEAKPEEKVAPAPQASSESKPKNESKPDLNSTPDTKAKVTTDLTPQIAARAYEIYEHQGHRDGQSAQNWDKAEQEIRATQAKAETKPAAKTGAAPEAEAQPNPDANSNPAAKVEPTPAAKVEPKPETKPDVKPDGTSEPKSEAKTEPAADVKAPAKPDSTAVPPSADKAEPKSDLKADARPTDKAERKPDGKVEAKPNRNGEPVAEVSPQLVKKVHKFYEQLGREDVRAVEESDQAKQKTPEVETKK